MILHFPRLMHADTGIPEGGSLYLLLVDYRFHNAQGGPGACQNPLLRMKRRQEGGNNGLEHLGCRIHFI